MQHYTIFFITVNAVHVSGCFSAHHQELKTVHTASGICQAESGWSSGVPSLLCLKVVIKTCLKLTNAECTVENS